MSLPFHPTWSFVLMRHYLASAILTSLTLAAPAQAAADRPVLFSATPAARGALVLPLSGKPDIDRIHGLDANTRALVQRALDSEEFDYASRSTLLLHGVAGWARVLIVGTGPGPLSPSALQDIGGIAAQQLGSTKGPVSIVASHLPTAAPGTEAELATGAKLGGYVFDKYKSADAAKSDVRLMEPLTIVTRSPAARAQFERNGRALAQGVTFARDLVQEPANALYPQVFVDRVQAALRGVSGVSIRVLDVSTMQRLGMGAIVSVGKGSRRPPRMLIVEYRGASGVPAVALAGKGITFDSGGISLKPGSGMWAMKGDMGGAAAVMGAVVSLARSAAPVHVIGIAALAENMPGGEATRPGDVVKAYNGKTIEILNTDAEGRLVLSDAVAFAEREYRPAAIVDIATLTGAVSTALGDEYAGLFSRNDMLATQLLSAGAATGEELWRLPLHPNYGKDMKSDIADIKNVVEGGGPGASLGAHFIGSFVESTPWAHLDIAGVDLRSSDLPTVPKGLSGFGVRLLDSFVRNFRPIATAAPAAGN